MACLAGRQTVQLDDRGRISFPVQYRTEIGEKLYISPDDGYRGFLVVRSEEGHQQQLAFLREEGIKNGQSTEMIEDIVRDYSMFTEQVTADKNGRLTISADLKKYASLMPADESLPKEQQERIRAVIVGIGDHAEIWAEKTMAAYEEQRRAEKMLLRKKMDAARAAMLKTDEEKL